MIARRIFAAFILCSLAGPAFSQPSPVIGPGGRQKASEVTAVTPTPDHRARQWLVLVDDKNYSQSWTEAGKTFQGHQKADAWAKSGGALREPMGAVASRGLKSIDLSRNNIAVVKYDTVFAHKAGAVETVTLAFENGGWSVSDYSVN